MFLFGCDFFDQAHSTTRCSCDGGSEPFRLDSNGFVLLKLPVASFHQGAKTPQTIIDTFMTGKFNQQQFYD